MSEFIPSADIGIPTSSAVDMYKSIDIPARQDILQMMSWYNWSGPSKLSSKQLPNLISYCDFVPGSASDQLTKHGSQRLISEVANNYLEQHDSLPSPVTQRIDYFVALLASDKQLPPAMVLESPLELFNGQIVDGNHRLIATEIYRQKSGMDINTEVYWGEPKNPMQTRIRYLKNLFRRDLKNFRQ